MYKLWSFTRRHARLDQDAYRAGHVGHHASMLRRLQGLRGYCVDLRADKHLLQSLGPLYREISFDEPAGFHDLWDGLSTLYFDSAAAAARAEEPEPTRATADGLSIDADWPGTDGPYLFDSPAGGRVTGHWPVAEHVLLPVVRPERQQTKLLQFFRRHPARPPGTFRSAVLDRYARLTARMSGLEGYTVNFRSSDKAPATDFRDLWDGVCELHLDSLDAFATARADLDLHPDLCGLERHLFEALWYAEADENVIVMPNRDPAPDFYYR